MKTLALILAFYVSFAPLYAQDTQLVTPTELTENQIEEIQYAKPSEATLAKLNGKFELLVFTRKNFTSCRGCELAHAAIERLKNDYPITSIYIESLKGRGLTAMYDVSETPTFVLVRRNKEGDARELTRWVGSRGTTDTAQRIKRAFAQYGYEPPQYDSRPPKHEPRPVPPPATRAHPKPQPRPSLWEMIFN